MPHFSPPVARAIIYLMNEQSVTTESAALGDLFQKYVPYIEFFGMNYRIIRPSRSWKGRSTEVT